MEDDTMEEFTLEDCMSYLFEYLEGMDLCLSYVAGDGNCFFRALSLQIYGTEERHQDLRKQVCDYMMENQEDLGAFFVDSDEPFQDYVDTMRKDGTWAGNMEIHVATIVCERDIRIYQQESSFIDISNNGEATPSISVAYSRELQHYDSVHVLTGRQGGNSDGVAGEGGDEGHGLEDATEDDKVKDAGTSKISRSNSTFV